MSCSPAPHLSNQFFINIYGVFCQSSLLTYRVNVSKACMSEACINSHKWVGISFNLGRCIQQKTIRLKGIFDYNLNNQSPLRRHAILMSRVKATFEPDYLHNLLKVAFFQKVCTIYFWHLHKKLPNLSPEHKLCKDFFKCSGDRFDTFF